MYDNNKTQVTPDDLTAEAVASLTDATNGTLQSGIQKAIEHRIPDEMRKYFDDNVFVFSGCKTYEELKQIGELLTDADGKVKPFYKFFRETRDIHEKYNKQYLQSEYIFATQSAQMAAKWAEFEKHGDRYNLQYRTANDDRVRYEHAALHNVTLPFSDPFWDKYMPPLGWRCRCDTVQVRKGKYEESDSRLAQETGERATTSLNKDGINTAEMFRFNPGKSRVIFPKHHPYFKESKVVQKVKDIKADKPEIIKADKKKQVIDLKEYIKGKEPTTAEINNIMKAYAEKLTDEFRNGFDKFSFAASNSYMMQHTMYYNSLTKKWSSGSTIKVSTKTFNGFNPAKELRAAFGAIKRGEKLTFNQEYSIESLWHEILHGKTKSPLYSLSPTGLRTMETVNQFCARHTYDGFLARLGGKAAHKEKILSDGYGYGSYINDFRATLKKYKISEKRQSTNLCRNYCQIITRYKRKQPTF